MTVDEVTEQAVGEGVERFMGHVQGWLSFWLLATGHRVGLLDAVRSGGGTAAEVAARAGTHERSTYEWLAGMTAAGYLQHDAGRFAMPASQAALFEGGVLPFDPTVLFMMVDVLARVQPDVERSLRDGSGVPYARYQPEFSAGQEAMNAPLYEMCLLQEWVPSVDGLGAALERGVDVADVGCGGGRALRLLAGAFPASRFTGYDLDEAALDNARTAAAEQGLSNLAFVHRDVADLGLERELDVVLAVDAVHDQAAPEQVLRSVHRALRPDGVFVVVEPTATGDIAQDAANPLSVIGYAMSLGHCVQVSLAGGGPGLGGMWGSAGAHRLFDATGFVVASEHHSPADYTVYAARPA